MPGTLLHASEPLSHRGWRVLRQNGLAQRARKSVKLENH